MVSRRVVSQRHGEISRHELREVLQRRSRSWTSRRLPGATDKLSRLKSRLRQLVDPLELGLDAVEAGGRPRAPGSGEVRHGTVFNNQTARRNQRRQFGVSELTQQPPHVAI